MPKIDIDKDIYDKWMVGGQTYKTARDLIAQKMKADPNFINFEENVVLVGYIETEQGPRPVYLQGASDVVAVSTTSKHVAAVIERGAPPAVGYCATIGGQLEKGQSGAPDKVHINGFDELFQESGLKPEDFELVSIGQRRIVEGDMRIEKRAGANTGIPQNAIYLMVSTPLFLKTEKPFTKMTTENEVDEGARRALKIGIHDLRDKQFGIAEHTRIIREGLTACGLGHLLHKSFGMNPDFDVRRNKMAALIPPMKKWPAVARRVLAGNKPA